MTADSTRLATSVAAICRAASRLRKTGRAPITLFWSTGHKKFASEITESVLAAELRANPDLINTWCMYSGDKRYSPAWYFDGRPGGTWVVGYFHENPSRRVENSYTDAAIACANFILREMGR